MSLRGDGSENITAGELMAQLESDPDFLRLRSDREQFQRRRAQEVRDAAAPITADLRRAGFVVGSLSDLVNRPVDYRSAIPILLKWLPLAEHPSVKEELVRALTVSWAKPDAQQVLLDEFTKESNWGAASLMWAIGNALSVVADTSSLQVLSALARDRKFGKARAMVAVALGNLGDPSAAGVLVDLLDDEQIAGHAVMALGRLAVPGTEAHLRPFLKHPQIWIRREA